MKHFLLIVLFVTTTSCSFFKHSGPPTKNVNGMEFTSLTLPNKLEVLLVHDTRFKKSSAAMAVMVGSLADPTNAPGMAHYLEHMLFLGTKSFPKPAEYSTFMHTNGGWDNAYTADEITDFFFEVDNSVMEGAMNRFSRFFVEPLFDENFLDREKNAVNSEFEKNLKSDMWRLNRFESTLAKPGHPFGKFTIGNSKTLAPIKRADVIAFYRQYYSSNNMKLVVMSAQPMESLIAWTHKYFGDVPNFGAQRPQYDDFYDDPQMKDRLHFVKAVENSEQLIVSFNIPDDRSYWASKPLEILSTIIGHECKGSLLSYLRDQGWALKLVSGTLGWRTFGVEITLTPAGRAHYDEVIGAIFQYIDLVKKTGYPESLFVDQKSLRKIDLDNLEPSSSGGEAAQFAAQMTEYPVDQFLERQYLIEKYSKDDFEKFLSYLKPENAQVIVATRDEKTNHKEDIFGIESASQPLVVKAATSAPPFAYPEKNKYIPTDFSLLARNHLGNPQHIPVKDRGDVFARQDTELGSAKGLVYFNILSAVDNTPMNQLLNVLFERSKIEELREWAYPIGQGRYEFYLSAENGDQMILNVAGYTQRLNTVAKDLINDPENKRRLSELTIDEGTFKSVKDRYKKDLQNRADEMAVQRLDQELDRIYDSKGLPWQDQLALIDKVTLKDVRDFGHSFFSKINVRLVAYGNIKEDDYPGMVDFIFDSLHSAPMDASLVTSRYAQFRVIPDGKKYSMFVKGSNNNNAAISIYKMADWSLGAQAQVYMLSHLISQPYFAELRTNQQLGYIAQAQGNWGYGFAGFTTFLQSGKYSGKELYERSNKFVSEFLKSHVEKVTEADLQPVKTAVINELLTKPNTLMERFEQLQNAAIKYNGRFTIRQDLAERVKAITLDEYKRFVRAGFLDRAPAQLNLFYSGTGDKTSKKDLPGVVFEKPAEVHDWLVLNPYRALAPAP